MHNGLIPPVVPSRFAKGSHVTHAHPSPNTQPHPYALDSPIVVAPSVLSQSSIDWREAIYSMLVQGTFFLPGKGAPGGGSIPQGMVLGVEPCLPGAVQPDV